MNDHATMRAAYLTGHGGNEVVCLGERPMPPVGPGEVRVRLQAATLNRVDLYMRDSGAGITHRLPQVMGIDGAGVIDAVGPGERRLAPGMPVVLHPGLACGRCEFCRRGETVLCTSMRLLGEHRDGTFAQFISLPALNVFALPSCMTPAEGAALGVNHLTAWRMLFTKGQLKPWHSVLIFGIGGGVSLAALQLAKMIGATCIVTSRDAGKLERAREMGADHVIQAPPAEVSKTVLELTGGRGVDLVIENVGAAMWSQALKSLVRGGRLVTCGATSGDQPGADLRRMFIRQLQVLGSTLGDLHEFADLLAVCAQGRVRPVIDSRWPLEEVHSALDRLASGQQFGKVVLDIG